VEFYLHSPYVFTLMLKTRKQLLISVFFLFSDITNLSRILFSVKFIITSIHLSSSAIVINIAVEGCTYFPKI
jgi:hypothetical protein